jgi:hypothetical protein
MSQGKIYELLKTYVQTFPSNQSSVEKRIDQLLEYYQDNRAESSEWTASYKALIQTQYQILSDYFIENAGDMFAQED